MKPVQGLIRTGFTFTNEIEVAWKSFHGIMVAYKPAGLSVPTFQNRLKQKICTHFNALKPPSPGKYVSITGPTDKEMTVTVHDDYSRHPLALGPHVEPYDITLKNANYLAKDSSGVLVMGVNNGVNLAHQIKKSRPTKLYRLKGILGQRTSNLFITGNIVVRSSYKHVKRHLIDKICASIQSSHQKNIFDLIGVDIQSEAAYKLAVQGPIKPLNTEVPMLYSIKCVEFNPPEFIVEIVCINENENYLKTLIDSLGLEMHTNATCTQMKCLQFGFFHITHAMVVNQMDIESVLHHFRECDRLIRTQRSLIYSGSPILADKRDLSEKHE